MRTVAIRFAMCLSVFSSAWSSSPVTGTGCSGWGRTRPRRHARGPCPTTRKTSPSSCKWECSPRQRPSSGTRSGPTATDYWWVADDSGYDPSLWKITPFITITPFVKYPFNYPICPWTPSKSVFISDRNLFSLPSSPCFAVIPSDVHCSNFPLWDRISVKSRRQFLRFSSTSVGAEDGGNDDMMGGLRFIVLIRCQLNFFWCFWTGSWIV